MGLLPNDVGDYVIYCFNETVAAFGSFVEGKLNEVEGKTSSEIKMKQDRIIQQYVGGNTKARYADPALMFARPKSGG